MSPKRWFFLLLFYIMYLFFGASIYYHIENRIEKEQRIQELKDRIEINEFLIYELKGKDKETQDQVLQRISSYCDKPVTNYTIEELDNYVPYKWTFYHAFFFAFTVCSTVGYGNISPTTFLGRMLLIPYSLLGMPVNGILFAGLGEYFSKTFTGIYTRYKKYRITNDTRYVPRQFGLIATIGIALLPGIAFFIILPSCLFTYFENWDFSLSVYYSYVTTTTIGFGDYVPTFEPNQPREFGGWFVFYQIFIIAWFIFSLGYLLMIITFITKALKSKKLRKMEQQLRTNIRQTQHKIWHGVSKDVGYLRRILNELYIMRFKPVYNEPGEDDLHLPRSISCPELTMYRVDEPIVSRKRAFSESFDIEDSKAFRINGTPMIKGSSDTDLSRINRQKTFETAEAFKHTTDLLAKVVTALASIETPPEPTVGMTGYYGDVQGFSDSQILASENSFNPADIPHRSRAMSDFYINPSTRVPGPNEWTWSGDNLQIQQAINNRFKNKKPSRTVSMEEESYTINMPFDETTGKKKKFSIADGKNFIKNWLPFKRRGSQEVFPQKDRKMSILSAPDGQRDDYPSFGSSYSTIHASQGLSGKSIDPSIQAMNSNLSLFTNNMPPAKARRSSLFPMFPGLCSERPSHERTVGPNEKPLFKPAAAGSRRGSLFTQNQRRGSLFSPVMDRKNSLFSVSNEISVRSARQNRRPSLFSVPSQEEINQDVLENTTIADLIRALEVMHTQSAISEPPPSERQRRGSRAPPISSLFALDNDGPMPSNRAYARRSTIMGTLSPSSASTAMPNRSRRMSAVSNLPEGPPPIYTEKESFSPKESNFRRRFSVRPTNLSTPIGKAPPPATQPSTSQSALGSRRPLYRPSPLARDPNVCADPNASTTSLRSSSTITSIPARLGTSSSHSPLARIAQISQAAKSGNLPNPNSGESPTSSSTDLSKRKD